MRRFSNTHSLTSSHSGTVHEQPSKNGGFTSGDGRKCARHLLRFPVSFAPPASQSIGCLSGCRRQRCLTAQLLPLLVLMTFSSVCCNRTFTRYGHGRRARKSESARAASATRQQAVSRLFPFPFQMIWNRPHRSRPSPTTLTPRTWRQRTISWAKRSRRLTGVAAGVRRLSLLLPHLAFPVLYLISIAPRPPLPHKS